MGKYSDKHRNIFQTLTQEQLPRVEEEQDDEEDRPKIKKRKWSET